MVSPRKQLNGWTIHDGPRRRTNGTREWLAECPKCHDRAWRQQGNLERQTHCKVCAQGPRRQLNIRLPDGRVVGWYWLSRHYASGTLVVSKILDPLLRVDVARGKTARSPTRTLLIEAQQYLARGLPEEDVAIALGLDVHELRLLLRG